MDLLERDHETGVISAALRSAVAGDGRAVAVSGESGSGKSALLEATVSRTANARLLRGGCDPLRTPRPLGPFRDLAGTLGVEGQLQAENVNLAKVCEALYEALRTEPTVLVLEDLHWVDAASVEVLRFLARRIDDMPLLVLLSWRDDEIGPRHLARPLLGDFARLDALATLRLEPLSVDSVRTLVDGSRLDPAAVHALTGGNAFFVAEIAKDPDRPLPASVRDAVLARTADTADADFEVLQLVATTPDRLDDRLLPALAVDLPTLRRLEATGLLTRNRGGLAFRHELVRQAIASTVDPVSGPQLHARLLAALELIGIQEPALLTHHAVAANDSMRATRYAQAAARDATAAGAHGDAAAFLITALDHLHDAEPRERAALLQQLSYQQYMISQLSQAIDNVRATFPLWQRAGDAAGLAGSLQSCSVYEYYSARRHEAETQVERAAQIASEAGAEVAYATALTTRAFLAYLRNDIDRALDCVDEAGLIARRYGVGPLALRTDMVRTLTALTSGDLAARAQLSDYIELARMQGWDELASVGYSQLSILDVEQRRFRSAEHVLDASLPFTVERDIPICHHWQMGVRSRLHFSQGHWSAAVEDAEHVLDEDGMPLARVWPNLVAALVALRQGRSAQALPHLEKAWRLANQIDEPLRQLPVLSALAEAMWLTGKADPRVTGDAVEAVRMNDGTRGLEWCVGDLAVWLQRLDLLIDLPKAVAEPFRLSLDGRAEEAAAWWQLAGDPFTEAMALTDAADPTQRTRGVELLDRLGASATADRLRIALRRDGVAGVPQRPRESTRANPAGLTNRQLDVAKLVARGYTNSEIAARLYISAKTADHHVSAVLTKLGLPSRRAVMMQAEELGFA